MKKTTGIGIVVAVIAVLAALLLQKERPRASAPSPSPLAGEVVIRYTGEGYVPSEVRVRKGGTVTFRNESSESMWPASAVHPTHEAYPTTGGCLGSTFDACRRVPPGESWSFTFNFPGEWQYHDHISASHQGKIIVEKVESVF